MERYVCLARRWLSRAAGTARAAALAALAGAAILPLPALAHDPFDGNIQLFVYANKIEAKVTLGYDASREFLRSSGLSPAELERLRKPAPEGPPPQLPAALAVRLLVLRHDGKPLAASALFAVRGEDESNFLAIYPRPPGKQVELTAAYLGAIEYMRPGMLVVADHQQRTLFSQLLSPSDPLASVPLTRAAADALTAKGRAAHSAPSPAAGFSAWFKLGVQHILEGYDHLLFLCALLIGMRGMRQMLVIISCFTLAHSVTLALSALNLASIRPAIVEPVIAASIAVACLTNLLHKDGPRIGYAMAGGFGLIHGFGFAGALREAGLGQDGGAILVPLLSFNLGVETGQLMVAALVVPALFLLRSRPTLARYGMPAISAAMTVASCYWLYQLAAA